MRPASLQLYEACRPARRCGSVDKSWPRRESAEDAAAVACVQSCKCEAESPEWTNLVAKLLL